MTAPDDMTDMRPKGILFFDGACGLCTRSVRFFLWADKDQRLQFAPLQGATAKSRLPESLRSEAGLSTVVYLREDDDRAAPHLRSSAVAAALIDLGGFWGASGKILRLIPKRLRDTAYDFIARHRFKLFPNGACPLPSPDVNRRLLD